MSKLPTVSVPPTNLAEPRRELCRAIYHIATFSQLPHVSEHHFLRLLHPSVNIEVISPSTMASLPNLATCKKLGFIVPSSNTAVEPITSSILHSLNTPTEIICLFTRIPVTTVGTSTASTSQFSLETMLQAARLLADAQPDAILWNGTSGMWTGASLSDDQVLATAMQDATGVPCSTTTLATMEALKVLGVKGLGVAVPYPDDLMERVGQFFEGCGEGFEVRGMEKLGVVPAGNVAIAKSGLSEIGEVVERASKGEGLEAVVVACTNWPAAGIVEDVERKTGVVVVDSIIVTVWLGLKMVGHVGGVTGWGRLMEEYL